MTKFNKPTERSAVERFTNLLSPLKTDRVPTGQTFEGAPGFARDSKSELFLLAVSNFVGEQTFYETASDRDNRFAFLVQQIALEDVDWLGRFLPWLRGEANLRSAAIVAALEAGYARAAVGATGATRQLVASVLQRADEPGEALAYWTSKYGRRIPQPVKRGIADAVQRLYTERALLKYDTGSKGFRFGDVLELVHAKPRDTKQGELLKSALDRRHHPDDAAPPEGSAMLSAHRELMGLPVEDRRRVVSALDGDAQLAKAGMTWEMLAGWLQGPLDAIAWEAVIPSMGFMAQLRNLRNFDQAEVSDVVAATVADRLGDPDEVAKSRQLPMRFLSAYRAALKHRWSEPLDRALGHSLRNVPYLQGRTLVLVDTSGSMHSSFSKDGTLMRWDAAAAFGIALGLRCEDADVVSFSDSWQGSPATKAFPMRKGESLLKAIDRWGNGGYFIGGGTDTEGAVRLHYKGHDRVVIITDEQAHWHGRGDVTSAVPAVIPVYTWNLAGYHLGHAPSGGGPGMPNRHAFGGLSDSAFRMIPHLEAGANADWPF